VGADDLGRLPARPQFHFDIGEGLASRFIGLPFRCPTASAKTPLDKIHRRLQRLVAIETPFPDVAGDDRHVILQSFFRIRHSRPPAFSSKPAVL
jgi:hypothetical protein